MKKTLRTLFVGALLAAALCATAFAADMAEGACTVTASSLNIRAAASTSSSVVSTVSNGTVLVVLDTSTSDWYYVAYGGSRGYVSRDYVSFDTVENFTATGKITGSSGANVRSSPSSSATSLCVGECGDQVSIIGLNNGWYKVKYGSTTGYIRSDLVTIVNSSSSSSSSSTTSSTSSSTSSTLGQKIAAYAQNYVGYKYVYGGKSPSTGFDCSGFVYYVYKQFGYTLTPGATSQYNSSVGYVISKSSLQPGDLVFFSSNGSSITHVGIYIGDGQFVHASTSSTGVIISSLSSSYYQRTYYSAKRIVS